MGAGPSSHMLGQWCDLPLVERPLLLWELLAAPGWVTVPGAALVVVLVVPDEPAALAIAAPPPTVAPVMASTVNMVLRLRLISPPFFVWRSGFRRTIHPGGRRAVG